jgi:hypothetical protein
MEDGDEVEDWPPMSVKETHWPPPVVSDPVTESIDIVSDVVTESIESDLTDDSVTASMQKSVAKYRPRGTARGGEYFRYSYKWYGKTRHAHIPGGNSTNPLAQSRAEEVRCAIASGRSVREILELIIPGLERVHSAAFFFW